MYIHTYIYVYTYLYIFINLIYNYGRITFKLINIGNASFFQMKIRLCWDRIVNHVSMIHLLRGMGISLQVSACDPRVIMAIYIFRKYRYYLY